MGGRGASMAASGATFRDLGRNKLAFSAYRAKEEKFYDTLSYSEKVAIEEYTDDNYVGMNNLLRGTVKEDTYSSERIAHLNELNDNLAKALDKNPLKHNMMLYRKTSIAAFGLDSSFNVSNEELNKRLQDLIGVTVRDKGFMSATPDMKGCPFTCYSPIRGEARLHLRAPKGLKGAYIDHASSHSGELEYIAQRGTKIKITGFDINKSGGAEIYADIKL